VPTYEYKCDNGHVFEVFQRMSDDPVAVCEQCEAPVQRVFHPVAVHFKGKGFYTTDYGSGKVAAGASSDGASEGSSDSGSSDSKSDAKNDSGSTEKKSDASSSDSKAKAGTD